MRNEPTRMTTSVSDAVCTGRVSGAGTVPNATADVSTAVAIHPSASAVASGMALWSKLALAALLLTAVACIATAGIGGAQAYFTTYCQAKGGYTLQLGDTTHIGEEFASWTKSVTITSAADSDEPVYVRVKAFGPEKYPVKYATADGKWAQNEDGYYYYADTLAPGGTTSALDLKITDVPKSAIAGGDTAESGEVPKEGDEFNVVVVYETTPVQYNADGTAKRAEDADWSQQLETHQVGAEGGDR